MQHASNLMTQLSSTVLLNEAMAHIYKRCQNDSHNSDIWSFHTNWTTHRTHIREQLLQGRYQLSPVQSFNTPDARRLTRWSAADAVVLKAFALCLGPLLDNHIDQRCTHLKGRGGLKGACRALSANISQFRHLCKSDVASFYDSDDSILKNCFYVRYMDDWVILTKTRRQLRRVIKKMHQVMDRLKFKLALDKTFIG